MKQILCADCGKPIKSVDNLATEAKLFFLGVKPYHFGCFKHFYEVPRLFPFLPLVFFPFRDRHPLNHWSNKWYLFAMLGFIGLLPIVLSVRAMVIEPPTTPWAILIFGPFILIGLYFLNLPYARILSYYKYEKPLKERK